MYEELLQILIFYLLPVVVLLVGIIALIFDLKVFREIKKSSKSMDDLEFTIPHMASIPVQITSKEGIRITKGHDRVSSQRTMKLKDILKEYGNCFIELDKSIDELKKRVNKMDVSDELKPIKEKIESIEAKIGQKTEKTDYENLIDEKINSLRNELTTDIKNLVVAVEGNMKKIDEILEYINSQKKTDVQEQEKE